MAQIVPIIVDIIIPATEVVIVGAGANFLARTAVFSTLKVFGAFDPRWDAKWPRVPWRPVYLKLWLKFKEWKEENFSFGSEASGGLAGPLTQMALIYREGENLTGRVRGWLSYRYHYALMSEPTKAHEVYVGKTRSGKTLMVQTKLGLMSKKACAFVIDPGGDTTHDILYAKQDQGHKLVVIDAFGSLPRPSGKICLLAQIKNLNEVLSDDLTTILCDRLATIQIPEKENSNNPFFPLSARQLWARLMAFVLVTSGDRIPHMSDVRKLLQVGYIEHADGNPELGMKILFQLMADCPAYDGYISYAGNQLLAMPDKTRDDVLSTARTYTAFWDHKQVRRVSDGNDAFLSELKDEDSNLILSFVAPVMEIRGTLKPFFACWTALSLATFEYIVSDLRTKTLMVVDEVQTIGGNIEGLVESFSLLAGYGISVTVVGQNLNGMYKALGQSNVESMIGGSQNVLFLANDDPVTKEFIAHKVLGNRTVKKKKWGLPFLWTTYKFERAIRTPEQVGRELEYSKENAVLLRAGKRPMLVKTALSFKELPVWLTRPSRFHGESKPRAFTRKVMARWDRASDRISKDKLTKQEFHRIRGRLNAK